MSSLHHYVLQDKSLSSFGNLGASHAAVHAAMEMEEGTPLQRTDDSRVQRRAWLPFGVAAGVLGTIGVVTAVRGYSPTCASYTESDCANDASCYWSGSICEDQGSSALAKLAAKGYSPTCASYTESDCANDASCYWSGSMCEDQGSSALSKLAANGYSAACAKLTTEVDCESSSTSCTWSGGVCASEGP